MIKKAWAVWKGKLPDYHPVLQEGLRTALHDHAKLRACPARRN